MNKSAIRNFAVWARQKLKADVAYAMGMVGITPKGIAEPLPQSTADTQFFDIGTKDYVRLDLRQVRQRRALVSALTAKKQELSAEAALDALVEEAAYTWFNRLAAIRFMEVNDYLPGRVRVLSSETPGKLEPDLVTTPFDGGLDFTLDEEAAIHALQQDGNRQDELFRLLFLKECESLGQVLPVLFDRAAEWTELVMNLSFTDSDGVVYRLTHDIPEDDFNVEKEGQVEIVGWLYQYYNTELKDETFALLKKNVKITKERIPSATQLFTPDWIVRYMVENSLGRLWLEGHPDGHLQSAWRYYLEEAPQEPEVASRLAAIRKGYAAMNPEDIKIIEITCAGMIQSLAA